MMSFVLLIRTQTQLLVLQHFLVSLAHESGGNTERRRRRVDKMDVLCDAKRQ